MSIDRAVLHVAFWLSLALSVVVAVAIIWGALMGEPVEVRAHALLAATLIASYQWGNLIRDRESVRVSTEGKCLRYGGSRKPVGARLTCCRKLSAASQRERDATQSLQ